MSDFKIKRLRRKEKKLFEKLKLDEPIFHFEVIVTTCVFGDGFTITVKDTPNSFLNVHPRLLQGYCSIPHEMFFMAMAEEDKSLLTKKTEYIEEHLPRWIADVVKELYMKKKKEIAGK